MIFSKGIKKMYVLTWQQAVCISFNDVRVFSETLIRMVTEVTYIDLSENVCIKYHYVL